MADLTTLLSKFIQDLYVGQASIGGSLALGTTSTDGWTLYNDTAATALATVQISPRLRLRGTAWDTAASETVDFFVENLPATAATPTGTLKIGYSLNGAAASYPMTLSSAGDLTLVGTGTPRITAGGEVIAGTNMSAASTGLIGWRTRGGMRGQADGKINFLIEAETAGAGIDVTTDATLKVRTRAQTGYATVDALAYQVSATPGIDASITTAALVGKTITVSKGIITGFA